MERCKPINLFTQQTNIASVNLSPMTAINCARNALQNNI